MLSFPYSKIGSNRTITISRNFQTYRSAYAGEFSWLRVGLSKHASLFQTLCSPIPLFFRLVVTENAQCYLWNQWCSTNKKPRNAKISHMENPSRSDAVKFFLHVLETEPYVSFNFKSTVYSHFQRLLSTPEKALLLTDANFAAKVNRSRKYPPCDINTTNFFDEEGDPIFVLEQQPCSPDAVPTAKSTSSKKTKGAHAGLKRTLCAKTAAKKKRTRKTAPPQTPTHLLKQLLSLQLQSQL